MKNSTKYYTNALAAFLITSGLGLVGTVCIAQAQNSPWTQKADMPTGRKSHAASVVGEKIYVIAGRNDNSSDLAENLVTEYDPAIDIWTSKTSIPTSRAAFSSSVANGKIYAIGGGRDKVKGRMLGINSVEEYDPATDTWKEKKNMPTPRLGLGTCVVNGKIYAIGGMTPDSVFWSGLRDIVEVYDPRTDTWSSKASMPTARLWFSASMVDGKIYVMGGCTTNKKPLNIVEVYDPLTNTWTIKTPMPTARTAHAAAVIDGIIYVIGGGTVSEHPGGFSLVEAYDPATDTWERKADLPELRALLSANVVDGRIYAIGGVPKLAYVYQEGEKSVFEYNPAKGIIDKAAK